MDIKAFLILVGFTFFCFLLTAWAVVNVAKKDFGSTGVAKKDFGSKGKKAFWWVIASVPYVGFLIYLIFGFRKGVKIDQ